MALQSQLFRGDPKLEAAAVSDPAHIFQGARGPHVAKIQKALIQLDGAAIAQDGNYGPGTAAAVSAFKQKRQILNTQGKIDNIVGKKTLAALDAEMLAKEKGGGGRLAFRFGGGLLGGLTAPAPGLVADVVVRYNGRAKSVIERPDNTAPFVLPDNLIKTYSTNHVGDRVLVLLGFETTSIPPAATAAAIINGHRLAITTLNTITPVATLSIYGSSSGGRVALELATQLVPFFPLAYVGVADAAFTSNDTTDRPRNATDIPPIPVFRQFGGITKGVRENFFQVQGNHARKEIRSIFDFGPATFNYTSSIGEEIHGDIANFTRKLRSATGKDDQAFHDDLVGQANPLMQQSIAAILNKIT